MMKSERENTYVSLLHRVVERNYIVTRRKWARSATMHCFLHLPGGGGGGGLCGWALSLEVCDSFPEISGNCSGRLIAFATLLFSSIPHLLCVCLCVLCQLHSSTRLLL